ncbi:MAG: AAA family ATPase, partial [Patescibacteria group bacterium]
MISIPILVITGLSCSGKTTCARRLFTRCNLPVFGKDVLKELLFDSLGCKDVAWSKQVDAAAYAILYQLFEAHLLVGKSCILESDFRPPAATPIFKVLLDRYSFRPIQLHLVADP